MGRVVSPQHEHCLRNRCQRLRPGRGWGGSQREPRLLDCEPDLQELMRDLSRQHFGKERWDGVAQLPLRVSHGASDDECVWECLKPRHLTHAQPAARPMERSSRGARLRLQGP